MLAQAWSDYKTLAIPRAPEGVPRGLVNAGKWAYHRVQRRTAMAKSQKKSNKEVRKPKAEKAPKTNASNPSSKTGTSGLVTIK
jgi:hypothetical protein